MARAQAPLKQVGMMCFMAWMFGNSIQIFSIMMTFTLIGQPLNAIMTSGQGEPSHSPQRQACMLGGSYTDWRGRLSL